MQLVSILFPLLGTRRHVNIDKKGRDSLDGQSMSSQEKNKDIYSMASLEMQISKNVDPLLRWAAQKEFTAENIVFLRAVRDFKKKWSLAAKRGPLNEDQMRDRFEGKFNKSSSCSHHISPIPGTFPPKFDPTKI